MSNALVVAAFLVLVAVVLGGLGVWVVALSDALGRSHDAWLATGRAKGPWVLLFLLGGWVTALYYLVVVRPALAQRA